MSNTNSAVLITDAYNAVVGNEVGGNVSIASKVSPPLSSGQSGWTVGTIQLDFNTVPAEAQSLLTNALLNSGYCSQNTAQQIGAAFTTAKQSSNVSFSGLTDSNGNAVTLAAINAALATPIGTNTVTTQSQLIFNEDFASVMAMVNNASLNPAVAAALNDPVQGPLLAIVLADYNNQYNIGPTGTMMQLLTSQNGSVTLSNGPTITLNTTNASTVVQSVMQMALESNWSANGYGAQACSRITNDVAFANQYDQSQSVGSLTQLTLSGAYGTCAITPNSTGSTFSGQWTAGTALGAISTTSGSTSCTVSGTGANLDFNSASLTLSPNASATLLGIGNTLNLGSNSNLTLNGGTSNSTITCNTGATGLKVSDSGSSNTFNLTASSSTFTFSANDVATISGNNNELALGAEDVLNVSGSGNSTAVNGANTSVTDSGSKDLVVLLNSIDTGSAVGDNCTLSVYGNSSTANALATTTGTSLNLYGSGDIANVSGTGNFGNAIGTNATITVAGNGSTANAMATTTGTSLNLDGSGDIANVSGTGNFGNAVGADATIVVAGNGSTANAMSTTTGTSLNLNGSGDIANVSGTGNFGNAVGADATITVTGNGSTANAMSTTTGTSLNLNGSGDIANVSGTGNFGNAVGTGATVNVTGNGSTANAMSTTTGTSLNLNGTGDFGSIYGTNDFGNAVGTGATINVTGNGSTANAMATSTGTSLNLNGSGDIANVSGTGNFGNAVGADATITVTGNGSTANAMATTTGTSLNLNGSGDIANVSGTGNFGNAVGADATITVTGNGSTANAMSTTTGTSLNLNGTGDFGNVYGTNDFGNAMGTGATINVTGNGSTANAMAATTNSNLNLNGTGDYANFYGSGSFANANASGDIVTFLDSASKNSVNVAANIASCTISGDGAQNTVNVATGAGISVNGAGAVINTNNDDSIGLSSSGNTVNVGGDIAGGISGITNTFTNATGCTIDEGTGNYINLQSGTACQVSGTNSTVTLADGVALTEQGNGNIFNDSYGGTAITFGGTAANNTVFIAKNINEIGVTGNGSVNTVDVGSGSTIGVNGPGLVVNTSTNDTIGLLTQGITIVVGGDAPKGANVDDTIDITNPGDTIQLAAGTSADIMDPDNYAVNLVGAANSGAIMDFGSGGGSTVDTWNNSDIETYTDENTASVQDGAGVDIGGGDFGGNDTDLTDYSVAATGNSPTNTIDGQIRPETFASAMNLTAQNSGSNVGILKFIGLSEIGNLTTKNLPNLYDYGYNNKTDGIDSYNLVTPLHIDLASNHDSSSWDRMDASLSSHLRSGNSIAIGCLGNQEKCHEFLGDIGLAGAVLQNPESFNRHKFIGASKSM